MAGVSTKHNYMRKLASGRWLCMCCKDIGTYEELESRPCSYRVQAL